MKKVLAKIFCVLLAGVTVFGLVACGGSDTDDSETQTYTFEAEYVNLEGFMGAGISNSGEGVDNIYGEGLDSEKAKGWSNGYFLGNTYAENTVEFVISSDQAAEGQLILRLSSEIGNILLNNDVFGVEVNGTPVNYSITVINSKAGSYDFTDYPIATKIGLKEGENVVKLIIKQNNLKDGNSIGAPFIDCIKISTKAKLTWNPLTENPDNRGMI